MTTCPATEIRKMISEHLTIPLTESQDHIYLCTLGADELDIVEILMMLEETFNVELPDIDYNTTQDFITQVQQALKAQTNESHDPIPSEGIRL